VAAWAAALEVGIGGGTPGSKPGSGGTGGGLTGGSHGGIGGFHRGGWVGDEMVAGAPRFHEGGILGRDERPIIAQVGEIILPNSVLGNWNTASNALAAMMAHRGALVGGSSSISHSFTLNGGVTIHGGGSGAPALADAFIRQIDARLGGRLGSNAAQMGRSRL
jgi:hypothetical protein